MNKDDAISEKGSGDDQGSDVVFISSLKDEEKFGQKDGVFTYKIDHYEPKESNDYVIRYCDEDYPKGFAKLKGGEEFETDFTKNNHGYDVYLAGREITKEEYEAF